MKPVQLALMWHQHQPYYVDDATGENLMPWVRLHGTKDYWGMAMLLAEVPEMRATINLVPSLLSQLQAYTDRGHVDMHGRVSSLPADGLNRDETVYLLDNFFMVHPDHMIRPYPRYNELYEKRRTGIDSASTAINRFSTQDIRDLQCWSNLAWLHGLAFERDADLAEFRRQGRDWTEDEKQWLLAKQMEILREVLPLHRQLLERGQIELTTTPFYHPILPLLYDKRLALEAMPEVHLPAELETYATDATRQIQRAMTYHEQLFGQKPRGMWPSEGSVCQEMIPAVVEAGIDWIATDEEILTCSTHGRVARDENGYLRNPELLYQPWRLKYDKHDLQIVFRDHALSDMIGFQYQRFDPQHAVDDLLGKVQAIGQATHKKVGRRPPLVNVILDGENCWEYYPNGGVDFLRALYQRLASGTKVKPSRIGDYLDDHPAGKKLERVFSGSWISHNFGIWIGHPECNHAWDLVTRTRRHLIAAESIGTKSDEAVSRAWEELMIAQGSDWFWWFGDSHQSEQDALFDQLFRKHLQNVYAALGDAVPDELRQPIGPENVSLPICTQPTDLLDVRINGRQTYFEWVAAGHYACSTARGTMTMSTRGRVSDLYFGYDENRLLIRLDARGGAFCDLMEDIESIRVTFNQPDGFELRVSRPASREPSAQLYQNDQLIADAVIDVAAELIFEAGLPWQSLGLSTDDAIRFSVDLMKEGKSIERIPNEGFIDTNVPSPEFELKMWQA